MLAAQGNVDAQYNLGVKYDKGRGVGRDHTKAVEWYEKAAQQGMLEAQYNLGVSYATGEGVRQDYTKAFAWYRRAAL